MSKKQLSVEMENVTIELPKTIMDFLRSVEKNPEEYIQGRCRYRLLGGSISCSTLPFFFYHKIEVVKNGNFNHIMAV